jgi:hypothetical protein
MLEYSAPESIRAEVEYRQARARELARHSWEQPSWVSRLFHHRRRESDQPDAKVTRLAA